MISTGIPSLDKILQGEGYPDKTAILILGAPGVGKEGLNYWFIQSGLAQGDFCCYVTRLPVSHVSKDAKAYGVDYHQKIPFFIARTGGELEYDHKDLPALSLKLQNVMSQNKGRRIRLVFDAISTLLMQHSQETVYNFLFHLFSELKEQYDIVALAPMEDGMHPAQMSTAMQQLFDGVLEFKFYEDGTSFSLTLQYNSCTIRPPLQ